MTATQASDAALWRSLAECPRSSLRWAALGYRAGVCDGRADVLAAVGEAGRAIAPGAAAVMKQPSWDELQSRRAPDYQPCPARCSACSRCIASLAYWSRGRPYLGVEQEAALARGAA